MFVWFLSWNKINYRNFFITAYDVVHMNQKMAFTQCKTSFDGNDCFQAFLFLFPKKRYAATYLYKTVDFAKVSNNNLAFNHISAVALLVNSSLDETDTAPGLSSSRNQHNFKLFIVQFFNFLLQMALNKRNRPG